MGREQAEPSHVKSKDLHASRYTYILESTKKLRALIGENLSVILRLAPLNKTSKVRGTGLGVDVGVRLRRLVALLGRCEALLQLGRAHP